MPVETTPDVLLFALIGGSVLVIALAIFWFLGSRHPRVVIATLAAFAVAVAVGVIFQIRSIDVEQMRRAEAQQRLEALSRHLYARQQQELADRELAASSAGDSSLPEDQPLPVPPTAPETPATVSAAWMPEVDEQFEADVYPSAKLASQALIREWISHFDKLLAKGTDKPQLIRITSPSRAPNIDELALLEAMDELVQKRFPEAATLVTTAAESETDGEHKAGEVTIRLSVSQFVTRQRLFSSADERDSGSEISGLLRADFEGRGWQFGYFARFVEKPWLTASSEFLSLRHGTSYVVVRSRQLASSAEEATRDVLGQAANQLGYLIDPREDQGLPRPASLIMLEQLEAGQYIADRFVQRLKRPYGDVYREAVLVDIGANNLRDMLQVAMHEVERHEQATERQTATRISGVFGILIVLGSLTALYLLLNWLTKGYYRGPLTVALCLLGSSGIVSLLLILNLLA